MKPKNAQKAVSFSQLAGRRSVRGPCFAQHLGHAQALMRYSHASNRAAKIIVVNVGDFNQEHGGVLLDEGQIETPS